MAGDRSNGSTIDPREVQDRPGLARYLSQSLAHQYRVKSGDDEISQTSTFIKSYLVETHSPDPAVLRNEVAPWFKQTRTLRDQTLLHLVDRHDVSYFADARDSRFLLLHSIGQARYADEAFERLTDGRLRGFDRAWMPAPFLKRITHGVMTGFKFWYRQDTQGFTRSEDELTAIVEAEEEVTPSPRFRSSFRLDVVGQLHADRDLQEMSRAPILVGRKALEGITFREVDDLAGEINLSTYAYGKMVGHGTSLNLYLSTTAATVRKYAATIRTIEDEHALGWERTNGVLVHRGAPFIIRFPSTLLIHDLQAMASSIFRPAKPFRLFGLFSRSDEGRVDVEAIDLHTGDPLSVEITAKWMRVYLPRGSCGNVVARLYTNLQHTLHSDIDLVTGSGMDLFAGAADEA